MRLHGAQVAIVECAHDEALSKIIQVLTQRQHIVPLTPQCIVQQPALHSGTERANGVFLRRGTGLVQSTFYLDSVPIALTSIHTLAFSTMASDS